MKISKLVILTMCIIFGICSKYVAYSFSAEQTFYDVDLSDWAKLAEWYDDNQYPYRIAHHSDNDGITYEYFNCENEDDWKKKSKKILLQSQRKNENKNVSKKTSLNNQILYTDEDVKNQNDESKNIGWIQFNGFWYYQDEQGNNKKGWQNINDKWYYFDPETFVMIYGLKELNGKKYYFGEDGAMVSNCWKNINNNNYYFDKDGHMIVNETRNGADGKLYYFDGNGVAVAMEKPKGYFNYAYNSESLNRLRSNCLSNINTYAEFYSLFAFSIIDASIETYTETLDLCYSMDLRSGNSNGIEEELRAYNEIREWSKKLR